MFIFKGSQRNAAIITEKQLQILVFYSEVAINLKFVEGKMGSNNANIHNLYSIHIIGYKHSIECFHSKFFYEFM